VLSDGGWIDGLDVTRRSNSLHAGHQKVLPTKTTMIAAAAHIQMRS
jgi:hypothetical protein